MAIEAELLLVESLVFGRLAMGEASIDAGLRDSWRLRRGGRLVFADETRLEHAGASLDRVAVGAGARAVGDHLGCGVRRRGAPERLDELKLPSLGRA
jgi:urease accessory protein